MLYQHNMTAFVDESGDHTLDVKHPGKSNLFVCAAVVVDDSDVDKANQMVIQCEKDFCSGSPLKSSRVGGKHQLRLKILAALAPIPFHYYATIIDKAQIDKDCGLRFKASFYKFMHRMLYERLCRGLPALRVVADRLGSKEFMDSFKPYLQRKALPTLWVKCIQEFQPSASTPLIRVADIIAGSLAWCFDPAKDCEAYHDRFLNLLSQKELSVDRWPRPVQTIPSTVPSSQSERDDRVRQLCYNVASAFIEQFRDDPSNERKMQVAVLGHLLLLAEQEPLIERSCPTALLIQHLEWLGFEIVSKRTFRQSVIGPLRDRSIIIAGDKNGYRLATSISDVSQYIQHDRSIIEPMLTRLHNAQTLLKTGSADNLDILAPSEFTVIREVLHTFSTVGGIGGIGGIGGESGESGGGIGGIGGHNT